jgi:hypothetical protein
MLLVSGAIDVEYPLWYRSWWNIDHQSVALLELLTLLVLIFNVPVTGKKVVAINSIHTKIPIIFFI